MKKLVLVETEDPDFIGYMPSKVGYLLRSVLTNETEEILNTDYGYLKIKQVTSIEDLKPEIVLPGIELGFLTLLLKGEEK